MQEDMEAEARISQPAVFTSLKKHKGNATVTDNRADRFLHGFKLTATEKQNKNKE